MTYRLITVFRDEEEGDEHIKRVVIDFPTPEEAYAHILAAKDRGFIRIDAAAEPMENGVNLLTAFVPIHQVIGWYVWLVPDGVLFAEVTK